MSDQISARSVTIGLDTDVSDQISTRTEPGRLDTGVSDQISVGMIKHDINERPDFRLDDQA